MAAADSAEGLIAEGNRAEDAGDLARACELYQRAVRLAPRLAKAHLNLGVGLEASGDSAGALASYEKALAIDPTNPAANYNLGKLLYTRGAYREADERLRQALESRPQFPEARTVRGYALLALGEPNAAASELETAVAQRPDDAAARAVLSQVLFNIAEMHAAAVDRSKSLDTYHRLLALLPGHAAALCNVGTIMKSLGRVAEALDYYRQAIAADPQSFESHYNLGITQGEEGRTEEALGAFRRAIELRPSMADAHFALGNALRLLDRKAEALAAFERALALDPDHVRARWSRAMAQLPAVYAPGEDPQAFRRRFSVDLAELDAWFDERRTPTGALGVGADQPFELAYQEENNRPLLERYGALCARLMGDWQQRERLPVRVARQHRPLRIGFVSAHLRYHSVWNAITKGWFRGLDAERFTLSAFHVGTDEDEQTAFAKSRAAHFERGPKDLRQWVDAIRAQQPDVLIYPEIGMDPMTLRLASLRLAPVQAGSWGHPETSGLPTIDYYLSAEDLEPQDAQAHYTERVVALPHLGCHFEPFNMTPLPADPERAGIDPQQPLLVCPGVPFKYAPQHDWIFPEIARRLGRCRFIFFAHWNRALSERLAQRLRAAFTARGLSYEDFVTTVPWQTPTGFLGWLHRADVFLDTIGFSGFNTALQAVESGLPIVTREGRFLRGRLASGILKRLGLRELVAPTEQAYVDLVVKLAEDSAQRQAMAARIAGGRGALYEDRVPLRALEDFLLRAAHGL